MHHIQKNAKELSEKELKELKENANGVLSIARTKLINFYPFCGSVAMKLDVVPVRDVRIETACTDGSSIFFDIDFLSTLTPDQQIFVLAHEVYHCVMMHMLRSERREHELFNIAADLEVNQLLKNDGLHPPKEVCFPDKFNVPENLSAEQYYDLLLKTCKNHDNSNQNGGANGSENSNGKNGKGKGGSGNSKLSGQFDKHIAPDENLNDDANGNSGDISDKYGKIGLDPDFSPSNSSQDAGKKANAIKEAIISAAQQVERQRGQLPAHLQSIVNNILECETPWQEILQNFTTKHIGDERMWNPPSRRHVWAGNYLQSRRGKKVSIGVVIDTSGSVVRDIPKFLGEINGIVKSFGNYSLEVVQCDTEVKSHVTYDEGNPLDLENEKFQLVGMSGTILNPGLQYFNNNDIVVDAICVFTDGYCEEFTENMDPGVPVLWMVPKGGKLDSFKFGEVHEFKND